MKLVVKNFGAIKKVNIQIKPLLLFIGQQGTGKSTLAKLITIFYNKFYSNNDSFLLALKYYNIDYALNSKTYIYFEDEKRGLKFEYKNNEFSHQLPEKEEEKWQKIRESENFDRDFNKTFSDVLLSIFDDLAGEFKHDFNSSTNMTDMLFNSLVKDKTIYIPAERILISNISEYLFELFKVKVDFPECFLDFGSKYVKARRELKTLSIPFLNSVEYKYVNNTDLLMIKGNKNLRLTQSSSGMQSSIPLAVVIEYFSQNFNSLFTIEEPELNLFPSTQKQIVHFLSQFCLKNNNKLIVTTHSPYIITSFANLIQAGTTVKNNNELQKEMEKIIPQNQWINFNDVSAYFFDEKKGELIDILDKEFLTINGNAIDDVSDMIADEFEKIMDIKYKNSNE